MKPIIIFRHAETEGPGYLGTYLNEQGIAWQLVKIDQGEPLPASITNFSGMVLMGGPMSVNDDLPWIAPLLRLIQEAYKSDIPLLGHCLGGQLISKALGATVMQNAIKEIGWGEVSVIDNEIAKRWFGNLKMFNSFHWHGETFSLPKNAVHLLSSPHCKNQAYAIGKHLAFQCHIEMTTEMVQSWCDVGENELEASKESPAVQQVNEMQENLTADCAQLNQIATRVYSQWIKGLAV